MIKNRGWKRTERIGTHHESILSTEPSDIITRRYQSLPEYATR